MKSNPNQKGGETMLNQCTLTGNLGADPEVFYSSEGNPVASFSLAFHSSKKKTGWIKVVCFQKLAEVSAKYLHKGARIAVIGTLDHHKWGTDEGIQKSSFQLIANSLEFIKTDGRAQKGSGLTFWHSQKMRRGIQRRTEHPLSLRIG